MPTQPAPPEPNPLAAQRAENREHARGILRRFIDIGANIADSLDPGPSDPSLPPLRPDIEAARAYDHVARAVRQAIMLADKLAEPLPPEPPEPAPESAPEPHPETNAAARTRILREVGDVIRQCANGERVEKLETELLERLDAPEHQDQLADRPIETIIAGIRRDMGLGAVPLTGPWKRPTPGIDEFARFAPASPTAPPTAHGDRPVPFLHGKHDP